MHTVIYAEDMEPITVIDLPHQAIEMMAASRNIWNVPVFEKPRWVSASQPLSLDDITIKIVSLWTEPLHRKGHTHQLVFTKQEEWALLLEATSLPGQRQMLRDAHAKGVFDGFRLAIHLMGGL